jgi:hypothetical protein
MNPLFIQFLGWAATAVFVGSYFFARPSLLRGVQMLGALLWITYGVLINASPVIVANVWSFPLRRGLRFARCGRLVCLRLKVRRPAGSVSTSPSWAAAPSSPLKRDFVAEALRAAA